MADEPKVKQGTIVCQSCGSVIDEVGNSEGVKTWYGLCSKCKDKESN